MADKTAPKSAPAATPATWIVTTSGERPVAEVAAALKQGGFEVGQVLGEIGVITGRCARAGVAALRKTAGVSDISPDAPVDIGPPGTDPS